MKIVVENAVARFSPFRLAEPVTLTIEDGTNWAFVGPNGAGKTLLADTLRGRIVLGSGRITMYDGEGSEISGSVKSVSFRDIYSLSDAGSMYYQQRWNSSDAELSPPAGTLLEGFDEKVRDRYVSLMGIDQLLHKRLVSLSSGELRKFLVARVLMTEPAVLILDNPFIGLDEGSRKILDRTLLDLSRSGLQIILVLSQTKDLPEWIDKVLPVSGLHVGTPVDRNDFLSDRSLLDSLFPETSVCDSMIKTGRFMLPVSGEDDSSMRPEGNGVGEDVVLMKNVSVRLGDTAIVENMDWEVHRGEKWALTGPNGSGKSTLLSLVCGDNPQAYRNDISIFGRRRGTGESIWDIKKRIGYLSPDMHTYYLEDISCLDVAASGFFDSIGLSGHCSDEQYRMAEAWMRCFRAENLMSRSFMKISYGEQRLVLLVRAFVKNPELLILDEPLHGLDTGKKSLAIKIIGEFCSDPYKTMIYVSHYRDEIPSCVNCFKTLSRN